MNGFTVTTAIPYVNAAPHLGHALELVQADVLARHRRQRGQPVRFQTGTDDNAAKNVTAARAAGVDVAAFVAAGADRFTALRGPLSLSFDDFVRTGSDPRHRAGVARLWHRCAADLYRRSYRGLYCAGCEAFTTPDELVDGRCAEHGTEPEVVTEENWFFRLGRYAGVVEDLIASGRVRIEPVSRRNEVLAFVRSGLADISVSRPAARTGGWGIPVPDDPDQVVYVWWDALANYVTTLQEGPDLDAWWHGAAERVHVIGKGIVRFHAVHWLALLAAAGLPFPTAILVHEYLSVDGAKISKSAGNGVDPVDLVGRFGVDALRWWFLREVARGADTDFRVERLVTLADRELAGGLGNLVQRTAALAHSSLPPPAVDLAPGLTARIDAALHRFDLRGATDALVEAVDAGNRYVEEQRPWTLPTGPARDGVLGDLAGLCRALAAELAPFLPDGAARLTARLDGTSAEPAFPRIDGPGAPAILRR